jgi:hypothetical protein
MKDAKGHGSDSRGAAAHQAGIKQIGGGNGGPGAGTQITIKHQDGEYAVPNGVGHYFTDDKSDAEATARSIHGQGITIKHRAATWGPEMD